MISLEDLKARFGYMFEGENIGLTFYAGWLPDFAKACEQIDALLGANKNGFHFSQAKEKFGAARYYFSYGGSSRMVLDAQGLGKFVTATRRGDRVADKIDRLIDEVERKSLGTCMICGAPGKTMPSPDWLRTLCQAHTPQACGRKAFTDLLRNAIVHA
ncbi:hypothetical protein QTI66_29055 [Variovorax sp. J22R133]|uniref:hypothetical protein n=1 Tax=Variovorax brevis TaxID=3053503 RepID=UPI002577704F|nr:hypothetical protein [Variovorax sp. J22R133]MDM0116219.1 hypothetical protein [Variovorax sp. J22R133]